MQFGGKKCVHKSVLAIGQNELEMIGIPDIDTFCPTCNVS